VAGLLEAFGHHQAVTEKKAQVPLAMPQQHLQIVLLTASQSSKSKDYSPKMKTSALNPQPIDVFILKNPIPINFQFEDPFDVLSTFGILTAR
jgi:hypothetical protein